MACPASKGESFMNYLAIIHKQLESTRFMLWTLALEAESEERMSDRDTLLDAMGLVIEELVKIELSPEWAEFVGGNK